MADHSRDAAHAAADFIRKRSGIRPRLGIVLGSGFATAAEAVTVESRLRFEELPGFPPAGVPGHAGELLLGGLGPLPVALFAGRLHFYEGHPMEVVTLPVRVRKALTHPILFDGRNLFDPAELEQLGFVYKGVGR